MKANIDAETFEREYAKRCGWTVQQLRNRGRVVVSCNCDYNLCQGWASIKREFAEEDKLNIVLPKVLE